MQASLRQEPQAAQSMAALRYSGALTVPGSKPCNPTWRTLKEHELVCKACGMDVFATARCAYTLHRLVAMREAGHGRARLCCRWHMHETTCRAVSRNSAEPLQCRTPACVMPGAGEHMACGDGRVCTESL